MSLHADLLAQARHLLQREPRRPRQASLRRAVSAAYYALFHLLVFEASRAFAAKRIEEDFRGPLARTFDHSKMYNASKTFAGGSLPQHLIVPNISPIPPDLRLVAKAFLDLQ